MTSADEAGTLMKHLSAPVVPMSLARLVALIAVAFAVIGNARADERVAQSPGTPPAPPTAQPLPQPADQVALAHFNAGNAAFRRAAANTDPAVQRTEYHDAAKEYLAAVKTESKHLYTLYWNLGQTYRSLGEYTRATHFYKKFLEFAPARYAAQRTAAEDHIAMMAAELDKDNALGLPEANPSRDPSNRVPPDGAIEQRALTDDVRDPPRWYTDTAGWALAGSGLAASLVGAGLFQNSSTLFDEAAKEDRESVQSDLEERARFRRGIGVATGAVGVACIAAGVIKLSITGSRSDGPSRVGATIGTSSFLVYGSF